MPVAAGEGKEEFGDEPRTRLGLHGQAFECRLPERRHCLVSASCRWEAARASPVRASDMTGSFRSCYVEDAGEVT